MGTSELLIKQISHRLVCALIFIVSSTLAQDDNWKTLGVDEIFQLARPKAFNKEQRAEAREMLNFVLTKSPNYHDVRILLARTFAWDGDYNTARTNLQQVLSASPEYEDALSALIDTELWSESYSEALQVADQALKTYPNNKDFMFKKATALNNLKRDDEALGLLQQILLIDPGYQQAAKFQQSIKSGKLRYAVGGSYTLDIFSRTFDPAHYGSVHLSRVNSWGSSIARVNYVNRFSKSGVQPEIDLYPRITNGMYAYLNYGYSSSTLFPKHRVGAELYKNLPHGIEISAGLRHLFFDDTTKVYIFTGSLGWYFKDYWLSLRPFITPDKEVGTSYSASANLRRYFSDSDSYLGFSGGFGFTPDERRFQSSGGLSPDGIYILKSQRFGVTWQKTLPANIILNLSVNFSRQEQSYDAGNYLWITSSSIWVRKRF